MIKQYFLPVCLISTLFIGVDYSYAAEKNDSRNQISDSDIKLIEDKKSALLYILQERGELEPILQELRKQKSDQMIEQEFQSKFPYSQEQITKRRKATLEEEEAKNKPLFNKTIEITEEDYDPNSSKPITIKVASNNPSSLAFFDYQGKPWPIVSDVIGDQSSFNSYSFSETKNTAVFEITKMFSESVALINLEGIDQLIVVKLQGSEDSFDAKKSIRIPMKGPLSDDTIMNTGVKIDSSDPILVKILNGEKITDGIEYSSDWDSESKFIRLGNYLYVRTRDHLSFPPSIESQTSANGYNLYKLYFTNSATMLKDGRYKVISITKQNKVKVR